MPAPHDQAETARRKTYDDAFASLEQALRDAAADVDRLTQERTEAEQERDAARAETETLRAAFEAYKASHPDTPPPPDPEPEPEPEPTVRRPLIGMSAPASTWATRKRDVEAGGGRLQARRIFLTSLADSLTLIQAAHAEGLLPVVSYKVGNDWAGVAAGKYDTQLKALADKLKALGKPVAVCLHHEPDQQSDAADRGEGGPASDFAAMYRRATPILKTAPNVQVWPIMNGWWWTDRAAALTDAQIDVWLPRDVRELVDGIAADDYSPDGGEPAVVKTSNRVAWAKRVGGIKALGIGETNAFTAKDLADVFALVATEPLFRGGFACVWNSTGGTYLPLTETGLLDDFQAILTAWPTA